MSHGSPDGRCNLSEGHWAPRVCAFPVHADFLLLAFRFSLTWENTSGQVTASLRPQFSHLSYGSLV